MPQFKILLEPIRDLPRLDARLDMAIFREEALFSGHALEVVGALASLGLDIVEIRLKIQEGSIFNVRVSSCDDWQTSIMKLWIFLIAPKRDCVLHVENFSWQACNSTSKC